MELNHPIVTVIAIALCFKTTSSKTLVQLTSDSPTTIGGTMTLFAKVVDCYGPLEGQTFRYTLEYFTRSEKEVRSSSYNFSISDWKSSGKYKVMLSVEKTTHPWKNCGSATINVIVTDTITASIKTSPDVPKTDPYNIGPVLLFVSIHDPSHMFNKVTYYWDFGDGTYMNNTQLGQLSHNFTQIKTLLVKVVIFGKANGRDYNGSAYKKMKFDGGFQTHVIVIDSKNISTLRLPSSDSKLSYVSLGDQVRLVVKYNNPYSIVQKCYAQWSIEGSGQTCSLKHTFTKKGNANIWVTPTLETKQGNISSDPFQKRLIIEEPISNLILEHKNYTMLTKFVEANIYCEGGSPFKMCWKLSMYSSSQSGQSLIENCTGLSESCRFHINHTISYKGKFQLDITVINRVGSALLVEYFSIPKPAPPPHHNKGTKEAISAVIPIVLCIIFAIILIFIIRKVYKIRHRSVLETANFDFRDEDCQSVDSLNLRNKWCSSFRFWKKNKEYVPLLENWNKRHSSSSLYSDIL